MDRGTHAFKFLLGKVIPPHLAYFGVINRSQADINRNKSFSEALSFEEQFFGDHPEYDRVKDYCGTPQLAKKLNLILEQEIRSTLPALKSQIISYFRAAKEELRTYGDGLESEEKGERLSISSMIEGKDAKISTKELIGGARIRYKFHSIFMKTLEVPFELLIRRQVERLLHPSKQCLQFARDELVEISRSCVSRELQRFPAFTKRVEGEMSTFIHNTIELAEKTIAETIDMEADDINTSHRNFVGGQRAIEIAERLIHEAKGTVVDVDQIPSQKRDMKPAKHIFIQLYHCLSA